MSHIISPEERAAEWRETSAQRGEARERRLHYVAVHMLEELRSEFDLYSGYDEEFVESLILLDQREALFDHIMMTTYQFLGVTEDSHGGLLALIASRLAAAADAADATPEVRSRASELAEMWRERLQSTEHDEYLTVAQVAARYGVTPQAVYKWIHKGKIGAEQTPGGTYRIPASGIEASQAMLRRRAETRRRLADRWREATPPSDEQIAEAIRETRREPGGL